MLILTPWIWRSAGHISAFLRSLRVAWAGWGTGPPLSNYFSIQLRTYLVTFSLSEPQFSESFIKADSLLLFNKQSC